MEEFTKGLYLIGTIANRSRKLIDDKGKKNEVIYYLIQTGSDEYYFVYDFEPKSYHEVGEEVSLPIISHPYIGRYNHLGVSYYVRKEKKRDLPGEFF